MKRLIALTLVCLLILSSCNYLNNESSGENTETEEIDPSYDSDSSKDVEDTEDKPGEEEELERDIVKLVVPEGYTVARIGMRLEEMEICTADEFLKASLNGDYTEFPLIAQQAYNENRCYNLEGYLFPDTYEIYRFDTPDTIIKKMLANNEARIPQDLRDKIMATGYTYDEIVTLASILQKEASERPNTETADQEMPRVASVLYNRMEIDMMLQCNVTATYVKGVLAEFADGGGERYNDYYNTYHCPALPAGAICNPGYNAIMAAVEPADTDYLFFLTDTENNFYYSAEYEDHLVLVDKYLTNVE